MLRRIVLLGTVACGADPAPRPSKPIEPIVIAPKTTDDTPTERGNVMQDKVTPFDESTLLPDVVLQVIQKHYMTAVKRCYTNHLKTDPAARGKVVLTFTVLETGRAANGKSDGFAPALDACIGGLIPSWEFPKPLDRDGEATQANFQLALQLIPD
jgi:hypothetical protein